MRTMKSILQMNRALKKASYGFFVLPYSNRGMCSNDDRETRAVVRLCVLVSDIGAGFKRARCNFCVFFTFPMYFFSMEKDTQHIRSRTRGVQVASSISYHFKLNYFNFSFFVLLLFIINYN